MTKKQEQQFNKHCKDLCLYLRDKFHMGEYSLRVDRASELHPTNDRTAAMILTDPVYLQITVTLYDPLFLYFCEGREWSLCEILVHEFCHVITAPFMAIINRHVGEVESIYAEEVHERQTQRIAVLVMPTIPKEKYKIGTSASKS